MGWDGRRWKTAVKPRHVRSLRKLTTGDCSRFSALAALSWVWSAGQGGPGSAVSLSGAVVTVCLSGAVVTVLLSQAQFTSPAPGTAGLRAPAGSVSVGGGGTATHWAWGDEGFHFC